MRSSDFEPGHQRAPSPGAPGGAGEDHSELDGAQLAALYARRFEGAGQARRRGVWRALHDRWLGRYIDPDGELLEIAAGHCEFINAARAQRRVALDLNPDTRKHAAPEVEVVLGAAERLAELFAEARFRTVFTSNFFEHCRSRQAVLEVLGGVLEVLEPGGQLLVLGPNFRYCSGAYFDYFDHHLPLTDRSLCEALELCGFEIVERRARTLPFSFRSALPSWPWLVRIYLRIPLIWPIFGAQFFIVARRPVSVRAGLDGGPLCLGS
jgi:hypothetical protein